MQTHDDIDELPPAERLDARLWLRLLRYALPYRRAVVQLLVCAVGVAGADASLPLVTRRLIDDISLRPDEVDLTELGLIFALIVGVLVVSVRGFLRAGAVIRAGVSHDIRRDGFDNLQRLSFAYYDRHPVGWLMARMTSDCERLSMIMAWGLLDFVWGSTLMGGIAIAMFVLRPDLAAVVLAVVPVLAWISLVFQRRILGSARAVRSANSRLTGAFNEQVMAVRTTRTLAREEAHAAEFGELTGAMQAASVTNALHSALYMPLVIGLASVAAGLALSLGGVSVLDAGLTLGTLVAFMAYTAHFFEPVRDMAHWFTEMQMAQASAERIFGLIDERPEIADSPRVVAALQRSAAARGEVRPADERLAGAAGGPRRRALDDGGLPDGDTGAPDVATAGDLASARDAGALAPDGHPDRLDTLRFDGVGFHYVDGEPVLSDIDLTVERGATVALVGPTGGGKSTLVSLVTRFYDPTVGAVLADGIDLRERSLAWLAEQFGIVLQDPHLFGGSVADNIRYGKLDASDAEVEAAARRVGAHEVFAALPDGHATEVGEGGDRLSTGQKQLVAFARVVLKDPPVLILDEATASVDTDTEQRLMAALEGVLADRTSFVIAHRLSTVRRADLILVIDGGRIVERGTHDELLALRGRYQRLCMQQGLVEARFVHQEG